jgi:hypothetical protein
MEIDSETVRQIANDDNNNNSPPYFENSAEYYYQIIQPDAVDKMKFNQLNKDLALSNLDKDNIQIVQMNTSIVFDINNAFSLIKRFKSNAIYSFNGELMSLVNANKALNGRYFSGITRLDTSRSLNINTDKNNKNTGR